MFLGNAHDVQKHKKQISRLTVLLYISHHVQRNLSFTRRIFLKKKKKKIIIGYIPGFSNCSQVSNSIRIHLPVYRFLKGKKRNENGIEKKSGLTQRGRSRSQAE